MNLQNLQSKEKLKRLNYLQIYCYGGKSTAPPRDKETNQNEISRL